MKLKDLYLILMLTIGTSLMAQEKYEQAVVKYYPGFLYISMEGKEYKKVKIAKEEFADVEDQSPVLTEIAQMRNDGWEVWNSNTVVDGAETGKTIYFLRRKLK